MSPVKRAPAVAAKSGGAVNFLASAFYAGGGGFDLPKGRYAINFETQNFTPVKKDGTHGESFLAVMLTCYPLDGGDAIEKPLSLGGKAKLSFVPSADGKGLEAIPGGPASTLNDQTNWNIFRQSLIDCGAPESLFEGDLSVLDGVWVQTDNVPEPESRKQIKSRTTEGQPEEQRRNNLVPIVIEILEDGKPWEGTGGFDNLGATAAAPKAAPAKPTLAKAPAKKVAPAPAPVEEASEDVDVEQAAMSAITSHLESNPNGSSRLLLRTTVFGGIKKAQGDDVAQAVQDTYFRSDDTLNALLGQLGYVVQGAMIKPVPA